MPTVPVDALVLGADQRQGLAVIRSLTRRGLAVVAGGCRRESGPALGLLSRLPVAKFTYPPPAAEHQAFLGAVRDAVSRHRPTVVIPAVESTVIPLDQHRHLFPDTRLALAPADSLRRALDKGETYALAQDLGVPIPATALPETVDEARRFAAARGYPLVLKPRGMAAHTGDPVRVDYKVRYLSCDEDFERLVVPLIEAGNRPVLQELCRGYKVCHGVLAAEGELLGIYEYAGEREYPLSGGVTALHCTRALTPDLAAWSRALITGLGWSGLAQVEYKYDPATGRTVLMEVNGRIWAPISGALKAGLDFPWAAWNWFARGERLAVGPAYPVGQRTRYLRGEFRAATSLLAGEVSEVFTAMPRRRALLRQQVRDLHPGVHDDVFEWRDPLPWLADAAALVWEAVRLAVKVPLRPVQRIMRRSRT